MKALLQVAIAVVIFGFSTAVFFCLLLGEVLRLASCDTLLALVFRAMSWLRGLLNV